MFLMRTGSNLEGRYTVVLASKNSLFLLLPFLLLGCLNHDRYSSFGVNAKPISIETKKVNKSDNLSVANPEYYLVKPGDTLYSIAFRFGLDYKKLASSNQINRSYRIYEGQSLSLKAISIASNAVTNNQTVKPRSPVNNSHSNVTESKSQKNDTKRSTVVVAETSILSWKWPHNGKIVRTYVKGSSSQKGIDLRGIIGDSVRAATNGVVVYAGNGLPGYGNLIILEHSNSILSAYAFAQNILVKEKDQVKTGQKIATMGKQGDQPSLHFEIRQNGKPVDPLKFLPKR